MAARNKSKKTTKSKTKKTGAASRAKAAAKRVSKRASSSSVRSRVGKSKPASNARVARKTIRAKMKIVVAKPLKRKRKNSDSGTASRTRAAAKRLAKAASARKTPPPSKSPSKPAKSAAAVKAARLRAKEADAKVVVDNRGVQEARTIVDKGVSAVAGPKQGPAEAIRVAAHATEVGSAAKAAAAAVKIPKVAGPEEAAAKSLKPAGQRQGFKLNEFVVYPAHGVGQIVAIEEQEVAGFKLELFVISFSKDKLTLRVPTSKVTGVGMRKISDLDTARRSLEILTGRARVKRTMWSRRAQEYESKINSGDINAIAEVVRDLYRSEAQPEQSYSERQLYEAALDRMVREIAAVQKSNEIDALKAVETQLQKGQSRVPKAVGPQGTASGEIEQAA
jgi:CarD family transcriptional regulator